MQMEKYALTPQFRNEEELQKFPDKASSAGPHGARQPDTARIQF